MQHKSSYYKKSGYSTPLNVLVDILTLAHDFKLVWLTNRIFP